jgi:hypothetical protein
VQFLLLQCDHRALRLKVGLTARLVNYPCHHRGVPDAVSGDLIGTELADRRLGVDLEGPRPSQHPQPRLSRAEPSRGSPPPATPQQTAARINLTSLTTLGLGLAHRADLLVYGLPWLNLRTNPGLSFRSNLGRRG